MRDSDHKRRLRPQQLARADLLDDLTTALEQIESGSVSFPKGGKRKAVARIKARIADLESRGVQLPNYRSTTTGKRLETAA